MAHSGGFGRMRAAELLSKIANIAAFREAGEVCKTSTPRSNPGGASNFP